MGKTAFSFHIVTSKWGNELPDADFTIGRGADPRGRTRVDGSDQETSSEPSRTGPESEAPVVATREKQN